MLAFTAFVASLAAVMEHVPLGLLIALDPEGKLVIANEAARTLLGMRPDEHVSSCRPTFRTTRAHLPVQEENLPLYRALRLGRDVPTGDYELRHRDGTSRILAMAARPLFGDRAEVQGAVASLCDVTNLRTQERHACRERDDLTQEISYAKAVAQTLQRAHFPQTLPTVPGFRLSGVYLSPTTETSIGGDWYDAFRLSDGRIALSIGDVMGHGIDAAATMVKLRQAMQSVAFVHPDPCVMLDAANATLAEHDEGGIATALGAVLDPRDATLTFAAAGHPLPLLRSSDGTLVAFEGVAPPLGVYEKGDAQSCHHFAQLNRGDLTVFYTDGLVEATRDASIGERLLKHALVGPECHVENSAEYLRHTIFGQTCPVDDVAILTVTREN